MAVPEHHSFRNYVLGQKVSSEILGQGQTCLFAGGVRICVQSS